MKKTLIICAACLVTAGFSVNAQSKKHKLPALPSPPSEITLPVPPAAPVPPVKKEASEYNLPPAPPAPPLAPPVSPATPPAPPLAPLPPEIEEEPGLEIMNENGYDISVRNTRTGKQVVAGKNGVVTKVKMNTWTENHKYYEKKFGHLPPQNIKTAI